MNLLTFIFGKKIIEKGKLGPGQIIAIDLKKGKLFKDKEIKDLLAKDYKKYNKQKNNIFDHTFFPAVLRSSFAITM